MARTRNISIGVSAALHARYSDLGMTARRAVLAEIRMVLEHRLLTEPTSAKAGGASMRTSSETLHPGFEVNESAAAPRVSTQGYVEAPIALPQGW